MPKHEKTNAGNGDKPQADYFRIEAWVNVRLSDADKDEIAGSEVDWPTIFAWMGERIYAGYRFSFSYDEYSKACQFSIICRADTDPNHGLAMSTRHPDVDMAFLSLYYKDVVLLHNNWVTNRPAPDSAMWD